MKQVKLLILSCLIYTQLLILNCFAKGAGSSVGITLLQPVSARSAAMADASSSLSGDITALQYNPAGISSIQNQELVTMYRKGMIQDNYASFLFGHCFSPAGPGIGAGLLYYDTGKIELYDSAGNTVSKVGQKDTIAMLGMGFSLFEHNGAFGVTVKGISSEIFGNKATAFAADIGAQYRGLVTLGFSVHNIGSGLNYLNKDEKLPGVVKLGGSYSHDYNEQYSFVYAVDIPHYINEEETLCLIGIECMYLKIFALRGGYKFNITESSRNDEQQVTAGIGFNILNFSISYSVGFTQDLDMPHNISFRMKFGREKHKSKLKKPDKRSNNHRKVKSYNSSKSKNAEKSKPGKKPKSKRKFILQE
ncbi:MAG: PorV/PorQ family protein [bacterium]